MTMLLSFILLCSFQIVFSWPQKFGRNSFKNVETLKIMGQSGKRGIIVTEKKQNTREIHCINYGILADVDADSEFKSSCGDTFNKMTINGTTVRYTSEVNKVAKCNIESTSQSIDVLCAKRTNTWYGDFYNHLDDNSNRHSSTLPQPQQIDADVPNLFLSAVWILGIGVLAHVFVRFSSLWKIAMYTHYVLMPIGVIIAIYAVALAKSESSSGFFEGSSHSIVGMIVLVLLCTNAILGIWHVAVGKR